ncbi:MAG TPA: DUF1415 domain-containing protein [Thermoanaerobaculia bacterium]|jgi:hypothetical protein
MAVDPEEPEEIVKATRRWLEKAVIGLNLCPFAKPVHARDQIRYVVTEAETPEELLADLIDELQTLAAAEPEEIETTLLIHPRVLNDFLDYNDFLGVAEETVADLGLEGVLQIASFHPGYQFAGTEPDDVTNYTNRSPYPTLHLLREASVEKAVATVPDTAEIYERNMETLRRLGVEGWRRLGVEGNQGPKGLQGRQGRQGQKRRP